MGRGEGVERRVWAVLALQLGLYSFYTVYRQSPLGPIEPSFRALSGRLKFTVRRHQFNKEFLSKPHRSYNLPPEVNHIGVELTIISHQRVNTEPLRSKESKLTLLDPSLHPYEIRRDSLGPYGRVR